MITQQKMKLERQEKIILSLEMHGFLTRDQIRKKHDLGGVRNTNRILKDLSPYVNSFFDKQNIYYLSKKGAERVGSNKKLLSQSMNYAHTIMRNELYIYFNQPKSWMVEFPVEWGQNKLIADVFFKGKQGCYFVEIDNTQSMIENIKKLNKYRDLKANQLVQKEIGLFPKLLWVTKSEVRKKRLVKHCEGLENEVYLLNDIR